MQLVPTAPMSSAYLQEANAIGDFVAQLPQVDVPTFHSFHAGVYARSATLKPNVVLVGAHLKIPTLLIISGKVIVKIGNDEHLVDGYEVIEGAENQKRIFVAVEETHMTMIFATRAASIEEVENEFTDEADRLLTRRK